MKHSVPGEIFIVIQSTKVSGSGVRGYAFNKTSLTLDDKMVHYCISIRNDV